MVGKLASSRAPKFAGLEATKAQLGVVAQTLSQHQDPALGSEAAPAAEGEPAAEGDVPHAEQAKAARWATGEQKHRLQGQTWWGEEGTLQTSSWAGRQ